MESLLQSLNLLGELQEVLLPHVCYIPCDI